MRYPLGVSLEVVGGEETAETVAAEHKGRDLHCLPPRFQSVDEVGYYLLLVHVLLPGASGGETKPIEIQGMYLEMVLEVLEHFEEGHGGGSEAVEEDEVGSTRRVGVVHFVDILFFRDEDVGDIELLSDVGKLEHIFVNTHEW